MFSLPLMYSFLEILMMLTVGICDDNPEQVDLLKRILSGYQGQDVLSFVCTTDPYRFLEQAKEQRFDLAFLDIDMADMNGIE